MTEVSIWLKADLHTLVQWGWCSEGSSTVR